MLVAVIAQVAVDAAPATAWTPAAVSGVIAAVVLLIGAFTSLIIAIAGLRKKADETAQKVDGHLSSYVKTQEVQQKEIEGLKAQLAQSTEAKKAAEAVAIAAVTPPPVSSRPSEV